MTVVKRVNAGTLPVRTIDGPLAILFGPAHETYGHFLIDYMPKLWVLERAGHRLDTLRLLVPRHAPPWARALLRGAGLRDDQMLDHAFWDEIVRTDKLLVPTIMRSFERLSPCFAEASNFWTRRIAALPTGSARDSPKKIYLSRSHAPATRIVTNREALEQAARAQGFAVLHPEAHSLCDQIALFRAASHVAGEYGSALHNVVFSQPGTASCALRGTLRDPGCIQTGLAASLGQTAGYVFGETEGTDRDQCVTVKLSAFERALEAMSLPPP